jgi:hypothetical protein
VVDDKSPEQYSDESRRRLGAATAQLVTVLQEYTAAVLAMRGGSGEAPELTRRSEALSAVLGEWNERVGDHTGTWPLPLAGYDDPRPEDFEVPSEPTAVESQVSVVSRWDLDVVDAAALVAAGREAHLRSWPRDDGTDAEVAVPGVPAALYALLHERGEPVFDLPGVEPGGARVFIAPDEPLEPFTGEVEDLTGAVTPPAGTVVMSEVWVSPLGPPPAPEETD